MAFVPRLTKPENGNPYYNTRNRGGYSDAIKGRPVDSGCDVLSNCVGYAYGRFNEIGGYGYCKYLRPTNAENFIQHANGLTVGQTPQVGACMVWRKGSTLSGSDGAGHVAIVEKVISSTEVVTSESGYGSKNPFWTTTRKKGNGRWGAGAAYTFLGFIYNPAVSGGDVEKETNAPDDTTTKTDLAVNGLWDRNTTLRLQKIFRTPEDGVISNQHIHYKAMNPGLTTGWDWKSKPNGKGSVLIKAMQKWAGIANHKCDGMIGPETIRAFQTKLGTYVDGNVSSPSKMVKALQTWANAQK